MPRVKKLLQIKVMMEPDGGVYSLIDFCNMEVWNSTNAELAGVKCLPAINEMLQATDSKYRVSFIDKKTGKPVNATSK